MDPFKTESSYSAFSTNYYPSNNIPNSQNYIPTNIPNSQNYIPTNIPNSQNYITTNISQNYIPSNIPNSQNYIPTPSVLDAQKALFEEKLLEL